MNNSTEAYGVYLSLVVNNKNEFYAELGQMLTLNTKEIQILARDENGDRYIVDNENLESNKIINTYKCDITVENNINLDQDFINRVEELNKVVYTHYGHGFGNYWSQQNKVTKPTTGITRIYQNTKDYEDDINISTAINKFKGSNKKKHFQYFQEDSLKDDNDDFEEIYHSIEDFTAYLLNDESDFNNYGNSLADTLLYYQNYLVPSSEIGMRVVQDFDISLKSFFGYDIANNKECKLFAIKCCIEYLEEEVDKYLNSAYKRSVLQDVVTHLLEYKKQLENE